MRETPARFQLSEAIALLQRTPGALSALLHDLPDSWVHARERENAWSVLEVVAHLIEGERTDWIPRAQRILDHGESLPFTPFDRSGHLTSGPPPPLAEMLPTFADLRRRNLAELRAMRLTPTALTLRGVHPELGTVTLAQLLATWTAHDLTHLDQIVRTMASRYRSAVGPWNHPDYLGILHRRK